MPRSCPTAGCSSPGADGLGPYLSLASAEIYDPVAGTWSATGSMVEGRAGLTMTALRDGRVLAVGGGPPAEAPPAEIYDPKTEAWRATGPSADPDQRPRSVHAAVLLADGRVLVAGGGPCCRFRNSAEIFDPVNGSWTATGSMVEARAWFTASLLADGTVLAAGSGDGGYDGIETAESYDQRTGRWTSVASMARQRSEHRAVVLTDGRVLVVGGYSAAGATPDAETYDPTAAD